MRNASAPEASRSAPPVSTDSLGLRRSIRPVVPVLGRAHVGHSPLVPVPAIEPIHAEGPETGLLVADDDEAVGVADVDAPGTLVDRPGVGAVRTILALGMPAVEGVVVADGVGIRRIHHVENVQAIFIAGDE